MTPQSFLALSKQLQSAEQDLKRARTETARLRHRLRSAGALAEQLVHHESFGLCVPGSGEGSGLDTVAEWPTHAELSTALRQEARIEQRVSELAHRVDEELQSN